MRVLITGASGFVGSHTLPILLAKGYEVHAVSSRPLGNVEDDINWHQVNLFDPQQTRKLVSQVQPTHLLHFAWFAEHGVFWTSLENIRWVQASLELMMAFQEHGGLRAVFAGTCAEYDWQYGYCRETVTPLNPATLYGICKMSLQKLVEAHAEKTGYEAAWGRIFFSFGARENSRRLVASVIRSLITNQPSLCSHGEQVRDFLYIDDLAAAFVALLGSDVIGSVNIASGTPLKIRQLVHRIAERLDRTDLVRLGALPPAPNDPPLLVADVSRLRDEVGWQPQFDLDTALDRTIAWWQQHL